jgi:urease accessory protein
MARAARLHWRDGAWRILWRDRVSIPFVETGIALSAIVLGAIVAFGVKASLAGAMGTVGLFAIFHGHAHGTEMPLDVAGAAYGMGFLLATAMRSAFSSAS